MMLNLALPNSGVMVTSFNNAYTQMQFLLKSRWEQVSSPNEIHLGGPSGTQEQQAHCRQAPHRLFVQVAMVPRLAAPA
jgi:hypothetical protein